MNLKIMIALDFNTKNKVNTMSLYGCEWKKELMNEWEGANLPYRKIPNVKCRGRREI